ncbi:Glycolipid transfer protein 3 [Dichanthelium oligosanthes]|uniref:Glycolipid transfer protein 3 n=1 Tax=Dichanthelium oligosanthes TaxID=888268 RepID=A0A1E5WE07_9POAL|nr:Glycolipid transfer protein 3 [Dichanthelium oligosanthes]
MVERERDEGEAIALTGGGGGQLQQEGSVPGKAEGERDGKERDAEDEREEEKDRGDDEAAWSEIRLAIEELSPAQRRGGGGGAGDGKPAAASPPTLPFLALSHLLLRVLDKIGPTMAVLRLDVQRNIERLQELYLLDPAKYSTLTEIVEKEVKEGTARKVDSCARAVLWLARSMDFTIALLQRLEEDSDLAQLVEAAYEIALKLMPERRIFTSFLLGMGQDCSALKDDIERLVLLLRPLLDDIHSMMAKFRLDRLKST